jgi:uncharacterized protein
MGIHVRRATGALTFLLAVTTVAAAATDLRVVAAAKDQNIQSVRALVNQGAAVSASQPDGVTALHWAAQWDNAEMADVLIRAGAQVNAANAYGVTPLSLACTNGSTAMVEKLLKAGANSNAATVSGETVLMTCARTGASRAVKALLVAGADLNAKETSGGQTALMWAAAEGHTPVVRVLLESGAAVDVRSAAEYTALMLSAREAHLETTQVLLAAGADVNAAAKDGTTALLVATIRGHLKYAGLLMTKGANPNLGPGFGPLHWAVGRWDSELSDASNGILSDDTEWSAFGGLHGQEKLAFVRLLLARGADPNARARKTPGFGIQVKGYLGNLAGGTPFLIAAKANDVAVMRELVAHGANPLVSTNNGTTPLMWAAGVGHVPGLTRSIEVEALEAVRLCLELGADINAANTAGDTALHGAAWRERADSLVQFLVDRGANLNAKNKRGWTPLVIAEGIRTGNNYVRSETTTALLRKLGAAPSPPGISREPQSEEP